MSSLLPPEADARPQEHSLPFKDQDAVHRDSYVVIATCMATSQGRAAFVTCKDRGHASCWNLSTTALSLQHACCRSTF
jgi:hypothetical protein